jgi:hypothetical protein
VRYLRLHSDSGTVTACAALNTRMPPLNDQRARQPSTTPAANGS